MIVSTLPAILVLCYALGYLLICRQDVERFIHERDIRKIDRAVLKALVTAHAFHDRAK
ncbi:hypothetical protein QF001_000934 [Paraburkholderia youngii]